MAETRLRSSFIYLANAANDLRGNWVRLAAVLAPLVILATLTGLPPAINLGHRIAHSLQGGGTSVGYVTVQEHYPSPDAASVPDVFPRWSLYVFALLSVVVSITVVLTSLVLFGRLRAGLHSPTLLGEVIEVYRSSISLALPFYWIAILQLVTPAINVLADSIGLKTDSPLIYAGFDLVRLGLFLFAAIISVWLYFSEFALIFDGKRSFHALLFSRDLMRGRFFPVAIRIAVFSAVATGYLSLAASGFSLVFLLIPAAVAAGFVWTSVVVLVLLLFGVLFSTTAFILAASVRLYQDLGGMVTKLASTEPPTASVTPEASTAPLTAQA